MHSISSDHVVNPKYNSNPTKDSHTAQTASQLHNLKNTINQLRKAYNGQEVDWGDLGKQLESEECNKCKNFHTCFS